MNRKILHLLSIVFLLTIFNFSSYAEYPQIEDAIETNEIKKVGSIKSGYYLVRKCKNCEELKLKLDKNTRAYKGKKLVNVKEVPDYSKSIIVIFFNPKTKIINRIKW